MPIERRDAAMVLIFAFITCGLYLMFWYYKVYEELESLSGSTPTGNSYWLDFILNIITCTLFGVWVDYKISLQLNELQAGAGLPAQDTTMLVVVLDIAAWVVGGFTNMVSSAIQQDQLNKVATAMGRAG